MNASVARFGAAERLAHALMFEGYVLYSYRRSSLKNMQRFSFGTLQQPSCCAPGTSDSSSLRVECRVRGAAPAIDLSARFLQHVRRIDAGSDEPWIEAVERACPHDAIELGALESLSFEHTVFDLALHGERATIASIEEDFEGRLHYAVTVDADPGRDLGADGIPGHGFFFAAGELERIL